MQSSEQTQDGASRRDFLKTSALAGVGAALVVGHTLAGRVLPRRERRQKNKRF